MGGWEWALHMPPDYPGFAEEALRQTVWDALDKYAPGSAYVFYHSGLVSYFGEPVVEECKRIVATRPIGTAERSTAIQANSPEGTTLMQKCPSACLSRRAFHFAGHTAAAASSASDPTDLLTMSPEIASIR